jgi:tetratricopeptide (TPR) repeat protein
LDGYTVEDVFQLIDRGSKPSRDGEIILDQRAHLLGERSGDMWLETAAKALEAKGFGDRIVLNSTREVVTGRKRVLGYYSWGSNDSSIKVRRFDFGFVPGALAAMFVSSDGRTFKEPPPTWALGSWSDPRSFYEGSPQSLTGDFIREGITGIAGHVAEPFLDAAIRPQILFPAYLAGFNLIESFYLAMPYLSWQTVVVGDPLCAPFRATTLSSDIAKPELDPKTELPKFFSARRQAALVASGVNADAAALILKGETRLARGDRPGGRQAMEAAVAVDGRLARINFLLASMDEEAGDYDAASVRYRAVLVAAPDNVLALNNLAYALAVRNGKPEEALPLALKAYSLSKAQPQIADTLGWIHYLLGNRVEAEKLLTAARDAAPAAGEIRLHLARVYADSGQKDLAVSELRRSLELQPELENQETTKDIKRALGLK